MGGGGGVVRIAVGSGTQSCCRFGDPILIQNANIRQPATDARFNHEWYQLFLILTILYLFTFSFLMNLLLCISEECVHRSKEIPTSCAYLGELWNSESCYFNRQKDALHASWMYFDSSHPLLSDFNAYFCIFLILYLVISIISHLSISLCTALFTVLYSIHCLVFYSVWFDLIWFDLIYCRFSSSVNRITGYSRKRLFYGNRSYRTVRRAQENSLALSTLFTVLYCILILFDLIWFDLYWIELI
jgi:hypothetical protein